MHLDVPSGPDDFNPIEISSPQPSTSATHDEPSSNYQSFKYSPFKHYLEISEKTIIGKRTVSRTKAKTPSAMSSKD